MLLCGFSMNQSDMERGWEELEESLLKRTPLTVRKSARFASKEPQQAHHIGEGAAQAIKLEGRGGESSTSLSGHAKSKSQVG